MATKIRIIRDVRVILDADIANLYGITTFNLNKAVARNRDRFPRDFMFRLTAKERGNLIFQSGISSSRRWGGARHSPYAFTEQGVSMLSSVLRSERAVNVNIAIMRAFVELRRALATHEELRKKIEQMERRYDAKFEVVFSAIKQMLEPPPRTKSTIGFHPATKQLKP
ncbi:MAG TPA: ORF6N domain-containing protein [Candidatus Acidoferrum sp.]